MNIGRREPTSVWLYALVLAALGAGCAAERQEDFDEASLALYRYANARYPEVVHLPMGCVGTVIAPYAVLTAGHCLVAQRLIGAWITWGDGTPAAQISEVEIISAEHAHEGSDAGLLYLATAVYPAHFAQLVNVPRLYTRISMIGQLRAGQVQPAELWESPPLPLLTNAETVRYIGTTLKSAPGDSGAPWMIVGTHQQIGVQSAIDSRISYASRIDYNHARIDAGVRRHGGWP